MNTQLQKIETGAIERPAQVPSVPEMLQAVIAKGVTAENVAALDSMVQLYERMQDKEAEKAFAAAFNALQAEMPSIQAVKAVPDNSGSTRYTYAPFEDIMEQVRPLLLKHGFTVQFSTEFEGDRIVKICTLQHISGHKRSNKFAARIGSGPPKASAAQADGAASTYAKRFALCDALNITIEKDTDARAEGGKISEDQAFELERRIAETNSDKAAFLKLAGVSEFSEMPEAKYEVLDQLLRRKEQKGR